MGISKPIRVGAVSYLNTKPLVYGLEEFAPNIQLVYDLPSRLADQLAAAELDVALIPSVEYLLDPEYSIVSNACIACRGPVLSVKLLSRVPMHRIRTLALDEGSRTSVALTRILLRERFGLEPELVRLPIGADPVSLTTDAVLLIGDRAIHDPKIDYCEVWDLGDQWCRWSKLPFVFAMWTARPDVDTDMLGAAFEQARNSGIAHLAEIAELEAALVRLSPASCLEYLRDNLHFFLGPSERKGLELFQSVAAKLGIVPGRPESVSIKSHS